MTATPLLTIAIPTFSRLAYLREAANSAIGQDYANLEVLISNDGPSPEIEAFGQQLEQQDQRVRYIRTPSRLALSGNWNWCVAHARGSHLVIIGDDDRLLPRFLSTLAPFTSEFDVVFADHTLIDDKGRQLEDAAVLLSRYGRGALPPGAVENPEVVAWNNGVAPSAALVRTTLARRLLFDPELNTPELDFFVRAAHAAARFYFVPEVAAEFRVHVGSATASGLTLDRLFIKLLGTPAATTAGRAAQEQQLTALAPSAATWAIRQRDEATLAGITSSGMLRHSVKGFLLTLGLALPRRWFRGLLEIRRRQID
jgi:glycosyltransferase involved in cell wall biosynthesis